MKMIEDYSFGKIKIGGEIYTSDVIVYPDKVKGEWWRKEGHSLCIDDVREILVYKPEILIVGTGAYGVMKVPDQVKKEIEEMRIKVIVTETKEACKLFNDYVKAGKKVVAALHLTC